MASLQGPAAGARDAPGAAALLQDWETGRFYELVLYAGAGGPNHLVSVSASSVWVRSPTQATYPSAMPGLCVLAIQTTRTCLSTNRATCSWVAASMETSRGTAMRSKTVVRLRRCGARGCGIGSGFAQDGDEPENGGPEEDALEAADVAGADDGEGTVEARAEFGLCRGWIGEDGWAVLAGCCRREPRDKVRKWTGEEHLPKEIV